MQQSIAELGLPLEKKEILWRIRLEEYQNYCNIELQVYLLLTKLSAVSFSRASNRELNSQGRYQLVIIHIFLLVFREWLDVFTISYNTTAHFQHNHQGLHSQTTEIFLQKIAEKCTKFETHMQMFCPLNLLFCLFLVTCCGLFEVPCDSKNYVQS